MCACVCVCVCACVRVRARVRMSVRTSACQLQGCHFASFIPPTPCEPSPRKNCKVHYDKMKARGGQRPRSDATNDNGHTLSVYRASRRNSRWHCVLDPVSRNTTQRRNTADSRESEEEKRDRDTKTKREREIWVVTTLACACVGFRCVCVCVQGESK